AITRPPSATSAFVIARPMPLLAPVTTAILPRRFRSTVIGIYRGGAYSPPPRRAPSLGSPAARPSCPPGLPAGEGERIWVVHVVYVVALRAPKPCLSVLYFLMNARRSGLTT